MCPGLLGRRDADAPLPMVREGRIPGPVSRAALPRDPRTPRAALAEVRPAGRRPEAVLRGRGARQGAAGSGRDRDVPDVRGPRLPGSPPPGGRASGVGRGDLPTSEGPTP